MGSEDLGMVFVDKEKDVDPFLVEALQNPRHRLTILRMELDIQNFLQNPDQVQFEFQHFPTSYLRLAAHRVAQHYGLQTMVLDNLVDGPGTKIMVSKTAETKYPSVCLSEISAKQSENNNLEKVKIAIMPRPGRTSSEDAADMERKRLIRTVEERKEEYDKAGARIFSGPSSPNSDETSSQGSADGKALCPTKDDNGGCQIFVNDLDKNDGVRDVGNPSRVAIFRDREKDRYDPDYDRSSVRRGVVWVIKPSVPAEAKERLCGALCIHSDGFLLTTSIAAESGNKQEKPYQWIVNARHYNGGFRPVELLKNWPESGLMLYEITDRKRDEKFEYLDISLVKDMQLPLNASVFSFIHEGGTYSFVSGIKSSTLPRVLRDIVAPDTLPRINGNLKLIEFSGMGKNTFHGQSGCPVFNSEDIELQGLLLFSVDVFNLVVPLDVIRPTVEEFLQQMKQMKRDKGEESRGRGQGKRERSLGRDRGQGQGVLGTRMRCSTK